MTNIHIIGNLGTVELKFTPSGKAVLNGSVAVNRRRFTNGEWVDAGTDWHRFSVWGDKAETYAEHLDRGQRVIVTGSLESRDYETAAGEKRTAWEVKATEIGIVPRAPRQATTNADPWAQGGDDVPPF